MNATQLGHLKGALLKQIAFKCGIQISGTKAILAQRLQDEIPLSASGASPEPPDGILHRTPRPAMKIVSIDMGIRNLAYCVLEVPAGCGLPKITDWKKIAVSSAPIAQKAEEGVDAKALEKESFEPHVLSAAAYTLMRKKLLLHNPTRILIERQRFRSMGSPHILEWTVRVNMLESMFYAVLHTLKQEGVWSGIVVPVAPGKVGPFWIEGEESVLPKSQRSAVLDIDVVAAEEEVPEKLLKKRNSKLAKIQNKGAKIDLVRNWLASEDRFEVESEEVQALRAAYLEKWERKPGHPKGKRASKDMIAVEEKMGKLDDLADCLLQGMAYIEWEENKQIAREVGIERLLDSK